MNSISRVMSTYLTVLLVLAFLIGCTLCSWRNWTSLTLLWQPASAIACGSYFGQKDNVPRSFWAAPSTSGAMTTYAWDKWRWSDDIKPDTAWNSGLQVCFFYLIFYLPWLSWAALPHSKRVPGSNPIWGSPECADSSCQPPSLSWTHSVHLSPCWAAWYLHHCPKLSDNYNTQWANIL